MDELRIRSVWIREFLAEFLGTFVLTCIGCSVNAFITVNKEGQYGHMIAPWGWGMALTAAIYVCGGVSGGHVNPAVTLGLASVGKLPFSKVPHYFLAQYLGAFVAAAITYAVYSDALYALDGEKLLVNSTAGVFGTIPSTSSVRVALVDQIVCVSFFLLLICAITDKRNMNTPKGLVPIAIGVTDLGLMIFAFGFNCGAPINPARDFAPRLFTSMAGWGWGVISFNDYSYFWIPIIGCHIGGVLGCWIYKLFIELHWPEEDETEKSSGTLDPGLTFDPPALRGQSIIDIDPVHLMLARDNSLRNHYKSGQENNLRSTLMSADSTAWPPLAPLSTTSSSINRIIHGQHCDQPPPYLDYYRNNDLLTSHSSINRDFYLDHNQNNGNYRSQYPNYHSGAGSLKKAISTTSLPTSDNEAHLRDRNSKLRHSFEPKPQHRKVAPSNSYLRSHNKSYLTPLPHSKPYQTY